MDFRHHQLNWLEDRLAPSATVPVLLAEPNKSAVSSDVRSLTVVGTTLYFAAATPETGTELYASDGTSAGTRLVKDINPGTANGPLATFQTWANLEGVLIFPANTPSTGMELWRSDGTSSGTFLVKDIRPGTANSSQFIWDFTTVGGFVYFRANDGLSGYELWRSDGTSAGTTLVSDIYPGAESSFPINATVWNGKLYFSASDSSNSRQLWTSDGTSAGTTKISDIVPATGSSGPGQPVPSGGALYFPAYNALWKTDGTAAGTVKVKDMGPVFSTCNNSPLLFGEVNGALLFAGSDATQGLELWRSDGTSSGTVMLRDIHPTEDGIYFYAFEHRILNGKLYFSANNASQGFELWVSDGSSSGTSLVKDINPGAGGSFMNSIAEVGGELFFSAYSVNFGAELWKSDGTSSGTVLLREISPGISSSYPLSLVNFNGLLAFSGDSTAAGRELWRSDGTGPGTAVVRDLTPSKRSSRPQELTRVGNSVAFTTSNENFRGLLWSTDGTPGGTSAYATPLRHRTFTNDYFLTNFNSLLLYVDSTGGTFPNRQDTLWRQTDSPTAIFTSPLVNTRPYPVGGDLYFAATTTSNKQSLFKYDGTVNIKTELAVLAASGNPLPEHFTNVSNRLFFTANVNNDGQQLWTSDGTSAGTKRVTDLYPGTIGSMPRGLVNVSGNLFFAADNAFFGFELYKASGANAKPTLVRDIKAGSADADPDNLVNFNGTLIFTANDGLSGTELWTSDGTSAGTKLIADIAPGAAGSSPHNLRVIGNRLYFSAANSAGTGAELWTSDGTSAGTKLLADLLSGPGSSAPAEFCSVNGIVYFSAADAAGRHLWRLDPATNKAAVIPLEPGYASNPASLTPVNDRLVFIADRSDTGVEIFGLQELPEPSVLGITVNGGAVQRSRIVSVKVNFAAAMDLTVFQNPGAVILTRTVGGPASVTVGSGLVVLPEIGPDSSITLTFTGASNVAVESGSLSDGRWQLSIPVLNYASTMDSPDLRRLFGDVDANGTVDAADLSFFPPFGNFIGSAFDFNNNGDIDSGTDLAQFGNRFGMTL